MKTNIIKIMDVVFSALILTLLLTTVIGCAVCAHAEEYPTCGIVTALDEETDMVYFTDFIGDIWSFYGVEDWQIGDIVAAIMDDMNTSIIYDDIIIKVQYCGRAF